MAQVSDLLETAERRAFVLGLRKQGKTYVDIARATIDKFGVERLPAGFDERYAWKDVSRELERLRAEIADSADSVIELEVQRLDAMLDRLWPKVENGDEKAVNTALRVMERRAKLLGLDSPTKQDLTSAGQPITLRVVYDELYRN